MNDKYQKPYMTAEQFEYEDSLPHSQHPLYYKERGRRWRERDRLREELYRKELVDMHTQHRAEMIHLQNLLHRVREGK